MKLTLSPMLVTRLAAGLPGPDAPILEPNKGLYEEACKTLAHLAEEGVKTVSRKDLSAVLHERGVTDRVVIGPPICHEVTRALSTETIDSGRRGYYDLRGVSDKVLVVEEPQQGPTLTRVWLDQQLEENDYQNRLTRALLRSYPREDWAELYSFVGLWIARWGYDGECDKFLAKGKEPKIGVFIHWLKQKHGHTLHGQAQNPVVRELKGVRTAVEVSRRKEQGDTGDYIHPDARTVTGKVSAIRQRVGGDSKGMFVQDKFQLDFTQEGLDPESMVLSAAESQQAFRDERASLAEDIIRVQRGKAEDRYARVWRAHCAGLKAADLAAQEDVTPKRAKELLNRVRSDAKGGPEMIALALRVLKVISDEPFSTTGDILDEMPGQEAKEVDRALLLLKKRGLAEEAPGSSFAPTLDGRDSLILGALR